MIETSRHPIALNIRIYHIKEVSDLETSSRVHADQLTLQSQSCQNHHSKLE